MSTNELPVALLQLTFNLGVGLALTRLVFYTCARLVEPVNGYRRKPSFHLLWFLGGGLVIGSILWSIQLLAREGFTIPLTSFMTAVLMVLLAAASVWGKPIARSGERTKRTEKQRVRSLPLQRQVSADFPQRQTCNRKTLKSVRQEITATTDVESGVKQHSGNGEPASLTLAQSRVRHPLRAKKTTDLISQHTSEGFYLYSSSPCLTLLGYKPDELVRQPVYNRKFFHLQYWTGIVPSHLSTLGQTENTPTSYRIHCQGGDYICFKNTTTPIYHPDLGVVEEIVPISCDIKDRKEEALPKRDRQFEKLVANVPAAIFQFLRRTDGSLSFPFVSHGAREIYNLEPLQIQKNAAIVIDLIHPDDRASFETSFKTSAETLQPWRWEGRFVLRSGKLKWLQAAARPELQANGDILWYGVLMDITKYKQTEVALLEWSSCRSASLLLHRRESLLFELANQIRNSLELETILETAVESIRNLLQIDRCHFIWYRSHEVTPYWEVVSEARNPILKSHLGEYPTARLGWLGKRLLQQQLVQVDAVETLNDSNMRQCLVELGYTSLLSIPIQTKLGEIGAISCVHCTGMRSWDYREVELLQAVVAQLAIAIDQAALYTQARETAQHAQAQARELERTLNQLKTTQAQLVHSAKMSSLGQLVAGIAHEINNPVNFIHGNLIYASAYIYDLISMLRLYQEEFPNPTASILKQAEVIDLDFLTNDLPKLLGSMQQGTDRIRSIVLSLRNFSRLDEAEMKDVNLHEGIDS
ncbi:MAG: PAS domain-containing protein, partial [Coleofasciculus sp. S288]|nr:PAS domain-containing protein [Coleofasciculus sp. S288]